MATPIIAPQSQCQPVRAITIEFLLLDLTTYTRCVGTQANLAIALQRVQQTLE